MYEMGDRGKCLKKVRKRKCVREKRLCWCENMGRWCGGKVVGWEGLTAVKGYISVVTFGLPQSGSQLALRPILIALAGVPGTAALLAWALIYAPVGVLDASCEKHRSINTSSTVQK